MRFLFIILSIFIYQITFSQNDYKVISFKQLDDFDASVNYSLDDNNGKKAGIIKVGTTESNFAFENGQVGIVKIVPKVGEIWVYVPEGTRRFDIKHPKFGVLRYPLPERIVSGKSYELILKTPKVSNTDLLGKGRVKLSIDPPDSKFYFGSLQIANAEEEFEHLGGNHEIKITNDNYVTLDTIIKIEPNKLNLFDFKLTPNWVDLKIDVLPKGATIKLNDKIEGVGGINKFGITNGITPGDYSLKVEAENYYPKIEDLKLKPGEKKIISYNLDTIVGELIINTNPEGAKIYIDNLNSGESPIRKRLMIGEYDIKANKGGFIEKKTSILIKENEVTTLNLDLINFRKALLPYQISKSASLIVFSTGLFGAIGSQVLANNKMDSYYNSTNSSEVLNLRNEINRHDKLSIIGYSVSASFFTTFIISAIKSNKIKKKYGLK